MSLGKKKKTARQAILEGARIAFKAGLFSLVDLKKVVNSDRGYYRAVQLLEGCDGQKPIKQQLEKVN